MMIDLHSHSTASDGTYSPQALLELANRLGIATFAITDHDTMAGYLAVERMANDLPIRLVSGVEISTRHTLMGGYGKNKAEQKSVHVVALDVKDCQKMQTALQVIQDSRATRGRQMVERLGEIFGQIDVKALWQVALDKAGGQETSLGRPHIAQALHDFGCVKSVSDAFDKYLGDDKPAYVPLATLTMAESVSLIHACGGFAVLAHPTRYQLSATRVRRLMADFAECGGDACELPSPQEPVSTRQMIDRQIAEHGFLVSVGSDFHGTITPWRKLGQVATPKVGQVGVWTKFDERASKIT